MICSNFDVPDASRQALAAQFADFVEVHTGLCVGDPDTSGRPVPVLGAPHGVAYELRLDPLGPAGIRGRIVGLPSGPWIWRPDFRGADGQLDAELLRWASGGGYVERPLMLAPEERRFLVSVRLRSRRDLIEACITDVRPLSLSLGGRPEALATIEACIESRFGSHRVVLPCPPGGVPPGRADLRPGGRAVLLMRRHGLAHAAIVAVVPADRVAAQVRCEGEAA